jgi:heterodisulfide reductase subunit B
MVLPQPNISFAKSVGFDVLSIDGDCGHMGPEIECYQDQVKKAVEKFLSN